MPQTTLQIPDDVSAEMDHLDLTVEGPEGSVSRRLWYPDVSVSVDGDEVVVESADDDAK
ncbi:50S ribosomal protein L6, partial [Halobacteriales archaeon QH_10_67_22]